MLASCFDKVLDVSDVDMEKTEIITSWLCIIRVYDTQEEIQNENVISSPLVNQISLARWKDFKNWPLVRK
jgi:hypothetical protein